MSGVKICFQTIKVKNKMDIGTKDEKITVDSLHIFTSLRRAMSANSRRGNKMIKKKKEDSQKGVAKGEA